MVMVMKVRAESADEAPDVPGRGRSYFTTTLYRFLDSVAARSALLRTRCA